MIESIDRYYRYRSFDGSIKIKIVFKKEVRCVFVAMAKNAENYANVFKQFDRYYRFSVYRWIDSHRSEVIQLWKKSISHKLLQNYIFLCVWLKKMAWSNYYEKNLFLTNCFRIISFYVFDLKKWPEVIQLWKKSISHKLLQNYCSRHGFLHQRMNTNGFDTKWFIFLEQ